MRELSTRFSPSHINLSKLTVTDLHSEDKGLWMAFVDLEKAFAQVVIAKPLKQGSANIRDQCLVQYFSSLR